MNRKKFFELAYKSLQLDKDDLDQLQWAYWLAKNAHRNQERDGGERYFEHCRRVAVLFIKYLKDTENWDELIDGRLNYREYVIVALLHDCIEDCFLPPRFIDKLYWDGIADAVGRLSKIKRNVRNGVIKKIRISDKNYYDRITESDFGIRIIKCLDRLDNIRDFKEWAKNRIEKYIAETKKYILPITKKTDEKLFKDLCEEIEKIKKGGEKNA